MNEFAPDVAKDHHRDVSTKARIIEYQVRGREAVEHQLGIRHPPPGVARLIIEARRNQQSEPITFTEEE